jgi:glycosyltransferase involved in cell wall biosynthesis
VKKILPLASNYVMSVDPGELQRIRETLERIERNQTILEKEIESLHQKMHQLHRRSWRETFQSQLWNFSQHPSRPLSVPASYGKEAAPIDAPSIAIVTPSLNHVEFLRDTIESVLMQNYRPLAYHVQDGGSSDGTRQLLQCYEGKLRWNIESDKGQADAINRGFERVDGDLMGYLNSDDMLLPGTLAYVASAARDQPDVDIFYGHRINLDRDGKEIGRCVLPHHHALALLWGDYVPQETMFWRRRVWEKIGPFDPSFQFALDWEFLLRAQAAGFRFRRLPRFLACFRVHNRQKTFLLTETFAEERARIRDRYLAGGQKSARRAFKSYLRRQGLYHRLYKMGLLKY